MSASSLAESLPVTAPGESEKADAPRWRVTTLVSFRFAFTFLMLFFFPFPLNFIPFINDAAELATLPAQSADGWRTESWSADVVATQPLFTGGRNSVIPKDARVIQVDIEPEEIGRNRGVDSVAAAFENLDAGLRSQRLAGRDDPVLRSDLRPAGDDGGFRGWLLRGDGNDERDEYRER